MKKIVFCLFFVVFFCNYNCVAEQKNYSKPSNDELAKSYNSTIITKNKLNIALEIINNYIEEDKDDSAQIWFDKISNIRDYNKTTEQDYFFQTLQTELYYFSDLLNLAEQSSNEALIIAEKLKNRYFLADAFFYKGLIQQANGNKELALQNFFKAGRFNPNSYDEKYANYIAMPNHIYNNIAEIYNAQKQWDLSYTYNKKALKFLKQNPNSRSEALVYIELAKTFIGKENLDSAMTYYKLTQQICDLNNITDIPLLIDLGLANLYATLNNSKEVKNNIDIGISNIHKNVNNYYTRIFYEGAISIFKQLNDENGQLKMYENLQDLYKANNKLYNAQLLAIYKYTNDNKNKLLRVKIESSKLKQRNANIQIMLLAFMLISLIISFILYIKRKNAKKKLEIVKTDIGKDLHDEMGATISSIKMYSDLMMNKNFSIDQYITNNEKISNLASDLGQKLRTIIWSMDEKNDTIQSLVEKIKYDSTTFFEDANIDFQFSVSESNNFVKTLNGFKRRTIFLVCKEALNNVLKHSKATQVWLYISLKENLLTIEIIDNGIGINTKNKFGNGMNIMKNRIEEIGGSFEITSNAGTSITITCNV